MDAYIYQAALLCDDCAEEIRSKLHPELIALADQDNDSDMAPQGPFADGGGESDCPDHCDHCGLFLENPLTDAGYRYVREQAADKSSCSSVITEWLDFYDIDLEDC